MIEDPVHESESRKLFIYLIVTIPIAVGFASLLFGLKYALLGIVGMDEVNVEAWMQSLRFGLNLAFWLGYSVLIFASGRARSRKLLETRRCPVPQEWIRLDDVVEIYPSQQLLGFRLLEATAVLLLLIVALGTAASHGYVPIWSVPLALLVFGLVGLYIRVERDVPLLRFDAEGLTSRRSRTSLWTFSVPWSQIDSCVLVNRRDAHSNHSITYPLFFDVDGKRRPSPGMWTWLTINNESSDRALGYLKARFPKLDFDNWDLT